MIHSPGAQLKRLADDSTVRIPAVGVAGGSGFFVAPGVIVSCAHVVALPDGVAAETVTVEWEGISLVGRVSAVVPAADGIPGMWPLPDLSVIEVDVPPQGHPWVILGDLPKAKSPEVYLSGFSDVYGEGTALFQTMSCRLDGAQDLATGRVWRIANCEIAPGMSGGPVLDLRSGVVCAITVATRTPGSDMGGLVIPAMAIQETFPDVWERNQEESEWKSQWQALQDMLHDATAAERQSLLILAPESQSALCQELRDALADRGFEVIVRPGASGIFTGGYLSVDLSMIDYAVILPDVDSGSGYVRPDARPNFYFELGYVVGVLGRDRVVLLTADRSIQLGEIANIAVRQISSPISRNYVEELAARLEDYLSTMGIRRPAEPTPYYSCFLSYSARDAAFVMKLVGDLSNAGVNCWLDTKDMQTGASIEQEIRRGLSSQDKLLLVLSRSSVRSPWVEEELRFALSLERERRGEVVFPLRLDNSVFESDSPLLKNLSNSRHISDFEGWENEGEYRKRLRSLVRDLTISSASGLERGR
jgi:TIR domain/Trypsin-like peptidase domain/Predicted nucleotide-binding protein containing TIR-like domain